MRRAALAVLSLSLSYTSAAWAADAPPPEVPAAPVLDDAMLTPLPPPPRVVSTWQDVTGYLRARSVDLRNAQSDVLRAEAQSRTALAAVLGTLNANASGTVNFLTNTTSQVAGVDANLQPIFRTVTTPIPSYATVSLSAALPIIAPRAWDNIRTAHINEDVSLAQLDDTKRLLTQNVAAALVSVVTTERVAELNRSGLRAALERLDLTRRRRELGVGTGLDLVRAQQDVEAARATLITGDESVRQSREALGLALGVGEPMGVAPQLDLDGVVDDFLAHCKVAPSAEDRTDVVAARARVALAHQVVTDAKMMFLPTLGAQSTLFTTTQDLGATPQVQWNVQGILSWSVWDGGVRYGALRDGHAQEAQAAERLEATRRTAIVQISQADRSVQVAEASRVVAARSRDLALEQDKLTRAGFTVGLGSSLELVTAAAGLRQAEINLALREFELLRARLLAVLTRANCPL